jgi:hypothetical protein
MVVQSTTMRAFFARARIDRVDKLRREFLPGPRLARDQERGSGEQPGFDDEPQECDPVRRTSDEIVADQTGFEDSVNLLPARKPFANARRWIVELFPPDDIGCASLE